MTPPSLTVARELLADTASKARTSGDPFGEIAASAIDVVLAELDRREAHTVPVHDGFGGPKIGEATVDGCTVIAKITDARAADVLRASTGPRGVSMGYRVVVEPDPAEPIE